MGSRLVFVRWRLRGKLTCFTYDHDRKSKSVAGVYWSFLESLGTTTEKQSGHKRKSCCFLSFSHPIPCTLFSQFVRCFVWHAVWAQMRTFMCIYIYTYISSWTLCCFSLLCASFFQGKCHCNGLRIEADRKFVHPNNIMETFDPFSQYFEYIFLHLEVTARTWTLRVVCISDTYAT